MKTFCFCAVCTWFVVSVMAAIISFAGLLGPEDNRSEWQRSEELIELQASEAGTARREAAGQALCSQEQGPQSEARWLEDGSLACTTARRVIKASL